MLLPLTKTGRNGVKWQKKNAEEKKASLPPHLQPTLNQCCQILMQRNEKDLAIIHIQ